MKSAATLALLCLAATPAAARLSAPEKKIAAAVDADQARAVALLEKLVAQNSGTRNIAGVAKVADMVRPEFEALGFTVRWVPQEAVRRAGHLIATHAGKPGTTKMLLIGHLDTVFEPSSPFQSFERQGDRLHGPGAGDDKGGVVVMLMALRAMQAAGTLKDASIEAVLTGDEENAGSPTSISRADLVAAGKRADVALDFEGLAVEGGVDFGSIARRSAGNYTITATAKTAHSSGIFSADIGDGAIYELARIIAAFRTELPEPNLTFNIGLIAGGATAALSQDEAEARATGKTNIIPPIAIARGDFRALSREQIERVKAKMQAIVARHLPHTDAKIEFGEGYPPMAPTAGNKALLDRLNLINADLGLPGMPPLDPLKRGRRRHQLRRGGHGRPGRPRRRQRRRPHASRDRQPLLLPSPGQARGDPDDTAEQGAGQKALIAAIQPQIATILRVPSGEWRHDGIGPGTAGKLSADKPINARPAFRSRQASAGLS